MDRPIQGMVKPFLKAARLFWVTRFCVFGPFLVFYFIPLGYLRNIGDYYEKKKNVIYVYA